MKRREFLATAAAGAAAFARWSPAARAQTAQRPPQAKLDRIAIMTLNFQSMLKVPDTQPGPERTLELFDLPGQPLRGAAELHPPQLGDLELELLDLQGA